MLSWSYSFSQRNASVVFEGKLVDSIDKRIDSILLVGTGSSTTRIFLDDLSQHLIKVLNDNGIEANYRYIGRTPTETQSAFDTINKKGYKAILFFYQKVLLFLMYKGIRTALVPIPQSALSISLPHHPESIINKTSIFFFAYLIAK
jgi:hypothetical protein